MVDGLRSFLLSSYTELLSCVKSELGDQGQTMKNDPNKDLYITEQYC
jgi:hypothetical protein